MDDFETSEDPPIAQMSANLTISVNSKSDSQIENLNEESPANITDKESVMKEKTVNSESQTFEGSDAEKESTNPRNKHSEFEMNAFTDAQNDRKEVISNIHDSYDSDSLCSLENQNQTIKGLICNVNDSDSSLECHNTEELEFCVSHVANAKEVEDFNSGVDDNTQNVDKLSSSSENSLSNSPGCSFDSSLDMDKSKITPNVPKKSLSLPYFYLPKPNLEDFIIEASKNFKIPEIKTNASGSLRIPFESKDTGDIVFMIDDTNTFKNKETEVSRNSPEIHGYQKTLKSIDKLDDSKIPGVKRVVLKEYLKKKIEDNKVLAFKQAKELEKLDDEIEGDNEEIILESESSEEEEFEEATVSFDKKYEKTSESANEYINSPPLSNNFNHDDDDDDIIVKPKKVRILDDDSCDEPYITVYKPDDKIHAVSTLEAEFECKTYENDKVNETKMNLVKNNPKENSNLSTELTLCLSEAAKLSCWNDKESPECSSTEFDYDRDDYADTLGLEICSSIPSYQPGGGFYSEEDDSDCSKDIEFEMVQTHKQYFASKNEEESISKNFNSLSSNGLNTPILEEAESHLVPASSNSTPSFGLTLDDPPLSQKENASDLFASQDLVDFCSGVFERDAEQESNKNPHEIDELQHKQVQDFFDIEAELSGDDDGGDDDQEADCDDAYNELDLIEDHELLSEEELRDEITDLHMKRMRDDDDELLKEIQEKFLEDGELNNDGTKRTRKFAWKNIDMTGTTGKDSDSSSDTDSEHAFDETWSSMNREKAKWRQECEKEEDSTEDLKIPSIYKKPHMKIEIAGKPKFIREGTENFSRFSCKRPRGSFLHLDDNSASQILKKLKATEEVNYGGSRTTKHYVFRNDLLDAERASSASSKDGSGSGSVFSTI